MDIVPNLHFTGECAAALELYETAFTTQRTVFLQYKDANPLDFSQEGNQAYQDFVYHAEMMIGGRRVMLTDHLEQRQAGINVSLVILFDDLDALNKAYQTLAAGARILTPLTATTYSPGFVSLVDRYGVGWELMVEN